MADKKISDMTALAAGSQATGDLLPVVDISEAAAGDKNKKMTMEALFQGIPGNVGIGTTSPDGKLDVTGTGSSSGGVLVVNDAGSIAAEIKSPSPTILLNETDTTDENYQIRLESGDLNIQTQNDARTGASTKVTIDSSGRVLIGTTTEGRGEADNLTIADSTTCGITIRSGTSSTGNLYFSDTTSGSYEFAGFVQYNHSNNSLAFGANTNEGMRIKDNGFVGVGLTNPQTKFVVSDSGAGGIEFQPGSSTGYIQCYNRSTGQYLNLDFYAGTHRFRDTSANIRSNLQATGEFDLYTDTVSRVRTARTSGLTRAFSVLNGASSITTGTAVMHVNADGDLVNDNNSYGAISDSKFKENIVDAASQWDDLKALQVRKYNFKAETGRSTHTQLGVIAQEVETVSPGLVENTPDLDDEGNDLGTVTKTVNYSVLYMKAVGALQEAMNRIETLEAKVAALEAG